MTKWESTDEKIFLEKLYVWGVDWKKLILSIKGGTKVENLEVII